MGERWDPKGPGFARTHPSPGDRLAEVRAEVGAPAGTSGKRQARFDDAVGGL